MAKYGLFKYGTIKYGNEEPYVFNRTSTDLISNTDKAYINYWDLNRIETRMQELADVLNKYSYRQVIKTKTDWTKQDGTNNINNMPILSQLQRIRINGNTLIESFFIYPTTPNLPDTFESLDIHKANDIEKILYDLHLIIYDMKCNFRECDTFYCGEE